MLRQAEELHHSGKFGEVRASMEQLVNRTAALRSTLEGHNISLHEVSENLGVVFATIMDDLMEAFPPTDEAPSHAERTAKVSYVLDEVQLAIVNLGVHHGVDEAVISDHSTVIRNHTQALVVTIGDLIEQHPMLFDMLVFSVFAMLIPEEWLLRPFLSLFGFGPAGPLKGSTAAGMQRLFWGAAVKEGSWFAFLQRAGMKLAFPPGTFKAIMGTVGAAVGAGVGKLGSYFGSST
ncbi:hypothetical protein F5I97DRAFT_1805203 [Phlebopus sp. FC_14]|nr:hypothetical protein F5I97DRAFT_1805203 [Phlebopus sp. FC_14]